MDPAGRAAEWPIRISSDGMVWLPPDRAERARIFKALFDEGRMIHVGFESGAEGVRVPDHLRGRVVFAYFRDMPVPITDLEVDERGIGARLAFDGRRLGTFLPWSAVFGVRVVDGEADIYRTTHRKLRVLWLQAGAAGLAGALAARASFFSSSFDRGYLLELLAAGLFLFGLFSALRALHSVVRLMLRRRRPTASRRD